MHRTLALLCTLAPLCGGAQTLIDTAYDRPFAVGTYAAVWGGAADGAGIGGRVRWEVIDQWLGVEVFGESLLVDHPDRLRHDHQIGFNLYVPFELGYGLRVRPLLGFCAVFSFIEPLEPHGPRADDVLFGTHAGAGMEWAFSTWGSVFLDAQGVAYFGHPREAAGWTAAIDDRLAVSALAQVTSGLQLHFGGP